MIKKEAPNPDVHYLQCGYCHWNSISIGAQAEATAQLIVALLRRERESAVQRQYAQIHDKRRPLKSPSKPRIKSNTQRPYHTFDATNHTLLQSDEADLARIMNLADGDIATVSSIAQRTRQPSSGVASSELIPRRIALMTRRTRHCARCDKLLVKPDHTPRQCDYSRLHTALAYLPRITLLQLPRWQYRADQVLTVRVSNPLTHAVAVSLRGADHDTCHVLQHAMDTVLGSAEIEDDVAVNHVTDDVTRYVTLKARDHAQFVVRRGVTSVEVCFAVTPLRVTRQLVVPLTMTVETVHAIYGNLSFNVALRFVLGSVS
jgi:hypothetical protein